MLVILSALFLLELAGKAQSQTASQTCVMPPRPPCENGVSPGVLQITPDVSIAENRLRLAGEQFYLSSCPFDLVNNVDLRIAPSVKVYYRNLGVSHQFIEWLERNHCQSVYCRELRAEEVTCEGLEPKNCVPEFSQAYNIALTKLNGNQELARKWLTNYPPLSSPKLRVGFYETKRDWLAAAVKAIEKRRGNDFRIRSAITDKDGSAFFYDLCPGSYYISSIGPIDIDGVDIIWETARPIKVEGPPDVKTVTRVTLAFPPGKDKKNYFVGKPLAEFVSQKPPAQ